MSQLSRETQQKMEGKIISYFHQGYASFVFLGCTLENPRNIPKGEKAFNPETIPGCVNALGKNKDIALANLIPTKDNLFDFSKVSNTITFKIRDRAKHDQIKSLVQG